jgi:hypothetical protein
MQESHEIFHAAPACRRRSRLCDDPQGAACLLRSRSMSSRRCGRPQRRRLRPRHSLTEIIDIAGPALRRGAQSARCSLYALRASAGRRSGRCGSPRPRWNRSHSSIARLSACTESDAAISSLMGRTGPSFDTLPARWALSGTLRSRVSSSDLKVSEDRGHLGRGILIAGLRDARGRTRATTMPSASTKPGAL